MESHKPKMELKLHRQAALAALLLMLASGPGRTEDNSTGPLPDADGMCVAADTVCEESCDLAKFTAAQREQCASGCKTSYDKCVSSAARKEKIQQSTGENSTDAKPVETDAGVKKKRKKAIKQP